MKKNGIKIAFIIMMFIVGIHLLITCNEPTISDRIMLGIAFLSMGLHRTAKIV